MIVVWLAWPVSEGRTALLWGHLTICVRPYAEDDSLFGTTNMGDKADWSL
jgi:hypothetical protein